MLLRLIMLLLLLMAGGCSVRDALQGRSGPELSGVRTGGVRQSIEAELGHPLTTTKVAGGGRVDVYSYQAGSAPSEGRAAAYAFFDLLSLGAWEFIAAAAPRETIEVEYDAQDAVVIVRKIIE